MIVKLLTEHHLGFLSLKGGCRGSSESTHVKMPHCWKSHATAQISYSLVYIIWVALPRCTLPILTRKSYQHVLKYSKSMLWPYFRKNMIVGNVQNINLCNN